MNACHTTDPCDVLMPRPVHRHERPTQLAQLGEALWTLTQPFFPLPWSPTSADNRMTVLRLRDGSLWVRLTLWHLQHAHEQAAARSGKPSAFTCVQVPYRAVLGTECAHCTPGRASISKAKRSVEPTGNYQCCWSAGSSMAGSNRASLLRRCTIPWRRRASCWSSWRLLEAVWRTWYGLLASPEHGIQHSRNNSPLAHNYSSLHVCHCFLAYQALPHCSQ